MMMAWCTIILYSSRTIIIIHTNSPFSPFNTTKEGINSNPPYRSIGMCMHNDTMSNNGQDTCLITFTTSLLSITTGCVKSSGTFDIPYSFEYKVRALFIFSPKNCGHKSNAGTIRVRPLFLFFCFYFQNDSFLPRLFDFQQSSSFQNTPNTLEIQQQRLPRLFPPYSSNRYLQLFHLLMVYNVYCGHYSSSTFIFLFSSNR